MFARLAAAVLVWFVRLLSRRGRRALSYGLADVVFALGLRRRVTLENLRFAYPELSEAERRRIARGAFRTMAFSLIEALASVKYPEEELAKVVQADAWAHAERALADGKGVIIATAHFGSWELLGEVMCRRGVPVNVVAKPLQGAFNAHIVKARLESGVKLIPPRGSVQACTEALARGEVVCLLIDQSIAADRGVFVPFFGRLASTTPAASLVAKRSGAPVFVAMAGWSGDSLVLEVEGPYPLPATGDERADLTAHTAALTAEIERQIRKHPEQWLWLHRRWKVPPPA